MLCWTHTSRCFFLCHAEKNSANNLNGFSKTKLQKMKNHYNFYSLLHSPVQTSLTTVWVGVYLELDISHFTLLLLAEMHIIAACLSIPVQTGLGN